MKIKDIIMLAVAAGFGFLGGLIAARRQSVAVNTAELNSYIVRTARIELVGDSDKARAVLALTPRTQDPTLSFLTKDGRTLASLGIESRLPFIKLMGADGKVRASLQLSGQENPQLVLGGGFRNANIVLGAFEADYQPEKLEPDWALSFGKSASEIASIGMLHDLSDQSFSGVLNIRNPKQSIRVP
jgi:hypothetical protein